MRKTILGIILCAIALLVIVRIVAAPALSSVETPEEPTEPTIQPPPAIIVENANEIGRFPVLMYHRIADKEGEWTRSRDNFRQDLAVLYERGYTIVNLAAFLSGEVNVPPGRTPVVLTFDDSTQGQFNYLIQDDDSVEIDPDCAVGIMLKAYEQWPELGLGGTFYINANPFGQRAYSSVKLQHLVDLGFEIGNHTYTHPKLREISDAKVQEEIAKIQQYVYEAVPGYKISSLALPFGIAPLDRNLAVEGQWNSTAYRNDYILEVGSDPAYPPGHSKYNPRSIPRIAVTEELFNRWLNWLDADPLRKYISDGRDDLTTVPDELMHLFVEK